MPELESDQAKLLLEVQKENQQLRMQLARMQQKLLSMESSAIMVARQSPALTPTHQHATAMCRTPVSETKMAVRHEECRAVEEALRKKMQVLEKERENALRDLAAREAQLASSMATLQRDHSLQIRHKDDFIRTLCSVKQPKKVQEAPPREEAESERDFSFQRVAAAASSRRRMSIGEGAPASNVIAGARRMSIAAAAAATALPSQPAMSKKPGIKRPALPATPTSSVRTRRTRLSEAEENLCVAQRASPTSAQRGGARNRALQMQMQMQTQTAAPARRLSKIPQPPPAPAPAAAVAKTPLSMMMMMSNHNSSGCKDPGGIKKRTFWDITNANSPSATAPVSRCTRSNTAATPSMLLQVNHNT